jgi:hypothetical protein
VVKSLRNEDTIVVNRPFGVHIDPANDGAEIVNGVADRVRAELLRNMQLADLLRPSSTKVRAKKASWS